MCYTVCGDAAYKIALAANGYSSLCSGGSGLFSHAISVVIYNMCDVI